VERYDNRTQVNTL